MSVDLRNRKGLAIYEILPFISLPDVLLLKHPYEEFSSFYFMPKREKRLSP